MLFPLAALFPWLWLCRRVVNDLLCQQTEEMHQDSNTDRGAPCRAGFGFGFVAAIVQLNWVYPPGHKGLKPLFQGLADLHTGNR